MERKYSDKTLRMRGMNLNPCILRMFEDTFSLDAAHIFVSYDKTECVCKKGTYGTKEHDEQIENSNGAGLWTPNLKRHTFYPKYRTHRS